MPVTDATAMAVVLTHNAPGLARPVPPAPSPPRPAPPASGAGGGQRQHPAGRADRCRPGARSRWWCAPTSTAGRPAATPSASSGSSKSGYGHAWVLDDDMLPEPGVPRATVGGGRQATRSAYVFPVSHPGGRLVRRLAVVVRLPRGPGDRREGRPARWPSSSGGPRTPSTCSGASPRPGSPSGWSATPSCGTSRSATARACRCGSTTTRPATCSMCTST